MTPHEFPFGQLPENFFFEPLPFWEFGKQRHPYEKPLYYVTLSITQIDPRVKAFKDISTHFESVLMAPGDNEELIRVLNKPPSI